MLKNKKLNILIILAVLVSLFTPYIFDAAGLDFIKNSLAAEGITKEEEAEMEAKIKELEEKIAQYRSAINTNRQRVKTLETEIAIFDDEMARAELEIQRINLVIQTLNIKIAEKEQQVREIERQVDLEKTALGELIREISRYDDVSFFEIILSRGKLSDFLAELRALENFQSQMQNTLLQIFELKKDLEVEKEILKEEKNEQIGLKYIQEEQRFQLENRRQQKETLLKQTKGQEDLFAQLVSKSEKDIEAIRYTNSNNDCVK